MSLCWQCLLSNDSPDATAKADMGWIEFSDLWRQVPRQKAWGNDSVGSKLWLEYQRNSVAQSDGLIEGLNFGASDMAPDSFAQPKLPSVKFRGHQPKGIVLVSPASKLLDPLETECHEIIRPKKKKGGGAYK